jgi:Uri superfamily endonuclease
VTSSAQPRHDPWTTRLPGTYLLLLHLPEPRRIAVGRLGQVDVPAGWYVYVGSALGGLGPRLRRHASLTKRYHWHIDALRTVSTLVAVASRQSPERLECSIATQVAALPGASRPVRRFGSSDCRCPSHLVHASARPDIHLDTGWQVTVVADLAQGFPRPVPGVADSGAGVEGSGVSSAGTGT